MENKQRFSDFVSYVENLAVRHKDIKHDPNGDKHFVRLDTDELDNSIRQRLHFPCVVMDRYSADLSGERMDKVRGVTLMFLEPVPDRKDYGRIHDTWDRMEAIADDFIAQIRADIVDGKVKDVIDIDVSSVHYELAAGTSISLYGSIVTFTLTSKFCLKPRTDIFLP